MRLLVATLLYGAGWFTTATLIARSKLHQANVCVEGCQSLDRDRQRSYYLLMAYYAPGKRQFNVTTEIAIHDSQTSEDQKHKAALQVVNYADAHGMSHEETRTLLDQLGLIPEEEESDD